ncbi:MAG TPA: hypothetical protein VMH90_02310, partial [Thermoplasmata archaeon]|nr:hypothetical protein [Thermoplasmata archaeon]
MDPRRPVLATGLAAFVLGNSAGDLSLPRETRGTVLDWGGPYALGVHLTGPWRVEYRAGDGPFQPGTPRSVTRTPGGIRTVRSETTFSVEE